jgi:hypothetical protein
VTTPSKTLFTPALTLSAPRCHSLDRVDRIIHFI